MSTSRRSTTGCTPCKTGRRKCDETQPQCLRCLSTGKACSYEYVDDAGFDTHRVKRTKPAPRSSSELIGKRSRNSSVRTVEVDPASTSSAPPNSNNSNVFADSLPSEIRSHGTYPTIYPTIFPSAGNCLSPTFTSVPSQLRHAVDPIASPSVLLDQSPIGMIPVYNPNLIAFPSVPQSPTRFAFVEDEEDGNDPEGVRVSLCKALSVDKNVKENTLAFTLHCYSEWAIANVFEPLKVVHIMREQVIAQFSSEHTRVKTVLIANVMEMFAKKFVIDDARKSILSHLALDVQKGAASFINTPLPFVLESDRQNAIPILDSILEIHGLQLLAQPLSDSPQLLDYAAPVFRRTCIEPPGQPVSLANALMNPSINIRYFATVDILMSIITGQPTYFQYEVPFSLEFLERMYCRQLQGNFGLQWLFGLPDQFLLLFAWINKLSETPGAGDNVQLVGWIEELLPQVRIAVDESGEPALRIGRMVVQECWRFTLFFYLYMVLCKADAYDPRVVRTLKGYMRLVRGVRPGRNPDLSLGITMSIVGVAATNERDRSMLRRRITNFPESAVHETVVNRAIRRLEDIWARTRDEGRPAVWADLRIADSIITNR